MSLGTSKILSSPDGAGIVDGAGELTKAARSKFTIDVISILTRGNEDGQGLQACIPPLPLPIFPIAGPKVILNPLTNPDGENLFWFKSEPFITVAAPIMLDPAKQFQTLFVDGIYVPLVKMLNIAGSTMLGPIIDPTICCDPSKFPNIKIPDLAPLMAKIFIQVTLAAPTAPTAGIPIAKLKLFTDFGISDAAILDLIKLAVPPAPPDLSPPSFSPPKIIIPTGFTGVPKFTFPDLALGILKIPTAIIGQILPKITTPSLDPMSLIKAIIGLIVDAIMSLLSSLGLLVGLPKTLLAFIMVLIKNLAVMMLCVCIGRLLGTGNLVKIVAGLGGLV